MPPDPHQHRLSVKVKRVDECATISELITHCFPAFGGAFLRRIYTILDHAIGQGCPLTVAVAGPVTVSGQHQAWLIPLLETGWVAYLSTTDAVCYHDGHRSLDAHRDGPIFEVPIWGDDGALRDERTIRVTDMAFDEDVLLDQDRFLTAVLQRTAAQAGRVLHAAGARQSGGARLALDVPPAGHSGVRGRAGRWQHFSEFHEAVGDARGRADRLL
jgi:deoxyhypusine synthase